MFAFKLLFVATHIQVHNLTTSGLHFTVANDTYIPYGYIETTVEISPYLPSYTHKAALSEYIAVPLRPGNHTIDLSWITVAPRIHMIVFNASGDMLLSVRSLRTS